MSGKPGCNAKPLWDRFHAKFVIGAGGCWLWTGAVGGRDGRAMIGAGIDRPDGPDKKVIYAARAAWILYRGPIPLGKKVLHSCDNPICVNPEHLFLGTQADNVNDSVVKGRWRSADYQPVRGDKASWAKLSADDVIRIRKREKTSRQYAAEYGVSPGCIRGVWTGRKWNWVSPP